MNSPDADPAGVDHPENGPELSPRERRRLALVLPLAMALALVAFGFQSLHLYNVTWDEALGDFFFGERYLSYFLSLDETYLDFQTDVYAADRQPDLGLSPFRGRPWEYYPFANTLAAASSELLARHLGLLDPFDGFHAINLAFAVALILAFFAFLQRRFGLVTAVAGVGFLFGSPRVMSHLMANIKDFPEMVLYTLTALAFYRAYEAGSGRGLLAAGGVLGLTLATKANGLFFPLLPAFLWLAGGTPKAWQGRRAQLFLFLVAGGALSLVVMFALWPYLWLDPIGHLSEHLRYIAFRKGFTAEESVAPVVEAILLTTPPAFLAFFGLGVVTSLPGLLRRDPKILFFFAWIAAVLFRYLLPQSINFDGVRHFLELFPAMAAVAAIGVARSSAWIARRLSPSDPGKGASRSQGYKAAWTALALLPGLWAVLVTHPFQICYWNAFAGGFDGARQAGQPQASDYWGTSYRLGLDWLNDNAEPDSFLVVPVIEHAVRLVAPLRLRGDIELLPVTTPFSPRIAPERLQGTLQLAAERPVYVMFVERRDWWNVLMEDCTTRLGPAMEWTLQGAPVLRIYRYRPPSSALVMPPLEPGIGPRNRESRARPGPRERH